MSYRQKNRNTSRAKIAALIALSVLAVVFGMHKLSPGRLDSVVQTVMKPFLSLRTASSRELASSATLLRSKRSLAEENARLKAELAETKARLALEEALQRENVTLRGLLGRAPRELNTIAGAVLSKPGFSPYDTIVVDAGQSDGVVKDKLVRAYEDVAIGYVASVYDTTSIVVLYTSPGVTRDVVIGETGIQATITGMGGGNFQLKLPRDSGVRENDTITITGENPVVVGKIQKIMSTDADSFETIFAASPVNIHTLEYVFLEI